MDKPDPGAVNRPQRIFSAAWAARPACQPSPCPPARLPSDPTKCTRDSARARARPPGRGAIVARPAARPAASSFVGLRTRFSTQKAHTSARPAGMLAHCPKRALPRAGMHCHGRALACSAPPLPDGAPPRLSRQSALPAPTCPAQLVLRGHRGNVGAGFAPGIWETCIKVRHQ
jgi:hypothetical protein